MARSVNYLSSNLKTPSANTFGVLLFGLSSFVFSGITYADCLVDGTLEIAALEKVIDGDTVKLKDGRHVRVIGVNAPEIDHRKKKTGQPLGEESQAAAEAFFSKDKTLKLGFDGERVDHYGRTLAHVYDANGNSLAAHLLRKGLGIQIGIPPNIGAAECLHSAEMIAKKQRIGVWNNTYWKAIPAANLTPEDTGFKRIQGVITHVRKTKSLLLEVDKTLTIKITPKDLQRFNADDWQAWQGKRIEARGWIVERDQETKEGGRKNAKVEQQKGLFLQVYTPIGLQLLD